MKAQGFSLLEVIVALVLITSTGMALFSWMNTNTMSLQRVQFVQQRNIATRNALMYINTINPLQTPQGSTTLGSYIVNWNSKTLEPPKDGMAHTGGQGFYQVGLYEVAVEVQDLDKQALANFTVREVGYVQVRKPNLTDIQ
jgi:general secretion pathway protein I